MTECIKHVPSEFKEHTANGRHIVELIKCSSHAEEMTGPFRNNQDGGEGYRNRQDGGHGNTQGGVPAETVKQSFPTKIVDRAGHPLYT